jgi:hypothetical protein
MSLTVCPSCARHVRDAECPFCGASVALAPKPAPRKRASRFAIYGAAVATAAATTACGAQALYGAPTPDASSDAADGGGMDAPATFYGAVMPDAGDSG